MKRKHGNNVSQSKIYQWWGRNYIKKEPYKFWGRIILKLEKKKKKKDSLEGFESKYVWWKNQQTWK